MMAHGRVDMNVPLEGPWELSRARPDAELLVTEDAGHLNSGTKIGYIAGQSSGSRVSNL